MRILLITVAGLSSRFSESIGKPCLKCIYYEKDETKTLLYQLISQNEAYDQYIIVGGFMYNQLVDYIDRNFVQIRKKITLICNPYYKEYGSGYSLYLGLKEALKREFDELVFAEGDLCLDRRSLKEIYEEKQNVITCNNTPILANKAVAFYYDRNYKIHYIYDGNHDMLQITEPFLGIFNSGQVWKFVDRGRLEEVIQNLDSEEVCKTNLVMIQKYFGGLSQTEYRIVQFQKWVNCNTIDDFKML